MERGRIPLAQLKSIGSMRDVYIHFPTTISLNAVLRKMGARELPVRTGDTLEDIVSFLYSISSGVRGWDGLWYFIARYFEEYNFDEVAPHLIDFINGKDTTLSRFVGDLLMRTFKEMGTYSILPYIELVVGDSRLTKPLRTTLDELGLSSVYLFIDRDPVALNRTASRASVNPEAFRLLIDSIGGGNWQIHDKYMSVATELVCLTLLKSLTVSESQAEFERMFKRLFETYLRVRHSRTGDDIDHIATLLSEINMVYESGQTPEYYVDYRKAVIFACAVYGVGLDEVLSTHTDMIEFSREFFN